MPITEQERIDRRRFIGSSDAAAICGIDPWSNAADVWYEKRGLLPERRTHVLDMGQYLEGAILQWAADQLQTPIAREVRYVHPDGIRAANLDGINLTGTPPFIAEAKTSGLLGPARFSDEFGDHGTDQVPDHIRVQCAHQLAVVNANLEEPIEWSIVPCLLGGRGFVLYRVPRSVELEGIIAEEELRFHRDHLVTGKPPPEDPPPSLQTLRALKRDPGKVVTLQSTDTFDVTGVVANWQTARQARLDAEKLEEEMQRYAIAMLTEPHAKDGEVIIAEAGELPDGRLLTYYETTRASYVAKASTYRTLRIKEPKKGRKG